MSARTRRCALGLAVALLGLAGLVVPPSASADVTYGETVGGTSNTWTDYNSAGGTAGPQIGAYATVQIACRLPGFRVADGNTWWYRIASSPWNYAYYVSADAFYNNGATSGSLLGTPWFDPAVPDCAGASGVNETTGGVANTWTDYNSAGGTAGPQVGSGQTIQIACKLPGFRVADGNTWWYRIASSPWNSGFYVSADAFYNNGATSGSLIGTPWWDPAVPDCAGSSAGSTASPTVTLAQGPAAPAGYRYAISLSGFPANSNVGLNCYDSVSSAGFYPFSLTTDGAGNSSTQSYCYSGDGPDHWVVANGRVESNHVSWSGASGGGGGSAGGGSTGGGGTVGGGTTTPAPLKRYVALGDSYSSGEGSAPFDSGTDTSTDKCHRSSSAWPRIVSRSNLSGVHIIAHIACSGATISSLTKSFRSEPPQLSQLAALPAPEVVTVTLGGNDLGFASILADCVLVNCDKDGVVPSADFNLTRPNGLKPALTAALKSIKAAAPGARVILVGYPNIFPTRQSSAINCGWMTSSERPALVSLTSDFNVISSQAASAAGVEYISTLNSLSGHEACTKDAWIYPIAPVQYPLETQQNGHPMALGQNAMAQDVVAYLASHK